MILRRFTEFVLQSRLHAMGTVLVCTFVPILNLLSMVVVALVALRKGAFEGALVLFAAVMPILIGCMLIPPDQKSEFTAIMVNLAIVSNLLAWAISVLLHKTHNWNLVLELTMLGGVFIVLIIHLLYPGIQDWWDTQLTAYFAKATQALKGGVGVEKSDIAIIVASLKSYITGFIIALMLLNALMQTMLARWLESMAFFPGGWREEQHKMRMGYGAGIVFSLGLLSSYWNNGIVLDTMPILYATFGMAGFSLLHYVATKLKFRRLWLLLAYLTVLLFPLSITLVAMIALLDTVWDIRWRLGKNSSF